MKDNLLNKLLNSYFLVIPLLGVFFVFLYTLYGSIAPYRDSGDLIVSSFTLGIAHPPGYFLYTILGKLFINLIPWGNIAYRVQIYSALFASLNGIMIVVILKEILKSYSNEGIKTDWILSGFIITGLISVFTPAMWSLSQVAEMYTQQAAMSLFIVWLVLKFYLSRSGFINFEYIYLASFMFGLTLGMHQTVIFFMPGYLYIIIKKLYLCRSNLSKMNVVGLAGVSMLMFILGLSLYIYAPLRSFQEPVMDWGNPENIRNFWRLISRADYGMFKLHPEESAIISSFNNIFVQIKYFYLNLIKQFNPVFILVAILGIWQSYRAGLFGFLFMLFVISGPVFSLAANLPVHERTSYPILEPNMILPSLVIALWIGMAFPFINRLSKSLKVPLYILIAGLIILHILVKFPNYNRRDNFLAHDYGRNIFRSLEKNSFIFDPDDSTTFITEYLSKVHSLRLDVMKMVLFRTRWGAERLTRLYPEYMPEHIQSNAQEYLNEFFRKNISVVPIYADLPLKVPDQFDYFPQGIMYRLLKREKNHSVERLYKRSNDLWNFYNVRLTLGALNQKDFFNEQILAYYMSGCNNLGLRYASAGDYSQALRRYHKALVFDIDFYEVYNNIGIIYFYRREFERALYYFNLAKTKDPNEPTLDYNIGLVYRDKKEFNEALYHLSKAETAPALNEMGYICLIQNDLTTAEQHFLRAIRLKKEYTIPYYNLGVVYEKNKEYQLAEKYYKMYKDIVADENEKKLADLKIKGLYIQKQ
ncbi:MAG: DUF2723 domain-containing protein [bacterium]